MQSRFTNAGRVLLVAIIISLALYPWGWPASAADARVASAQTLLPRISEVGIAKKRLLVVGQNFVEGAKLLINGESQKTLFESRNRIVGKKAGKKIEPGDVLQVRNPDGSVSVGFRYETKPYAVPVNANDLVYVPTRDRVYASVASGSTGYADSIVVINPRNRKVESAIPVGKQPNRLALSPDEHYLYVVLDGPVVSRIDLATQQPDLTFPLTLDGVSETLRLTDIDVLPDQPGSVVVSLAFQEHTGHAGVAVFDNGVRRPLVSPRTMNPTKVCFGASPDTLWGYNQEDTGFDLYRLRVDARGVEAVGDSVRGLLYGFGRSFVFNNGLLYTGDGRVIDPEARTQDGWFYDYDITFASNVTLAPEEGRAYVGVRNDYRLILYSFDLKTYQMTSYYNGQTYGVGETPTRVAWCGPSGLAMVGYGLQQNSIVFFPRGFFEALPDYPRPDPTPVNNQVRRIPLLNNGLIYDERNRALYATTPGIQGDVGNSVVKIDPFTGTVGEAAWVGSEPWPMMISDGGHYLYVAPQGATRVQRLSLPDLKPDLRVPLFSDALYGRTAFVASQMLPVPGKPESVIVKTDGLAVYDNGISRPVVTPGWPYGNDEGPIDVMQLSSSGEILYGLNNEASDFSFFKASLGADGVRVVARKYDIGNGFESDMKCENGLCFTNGGVIIDAEAMTRKGLILVYDASLDFVFSTAVAPDTKHNRVFYLIERNSGMFIDGYDLTALKKVASYKIPDLRGTAFKFLIWNDNQFALSTGNEIVLVPMSLLQPVP